MGELDASAIRGYLFIRNRLDSCIYVLDTDEGQVTAEIRSSKIKIGLTRTGQTVRYSLRAECGVEIREEYGNTPLDAARLRQIEERLESIIEGDLRAAVAGSVTAYGCDILGLGRLTMQKLPDVIRGFEEEWPEKLRQCGFDYGVSLTIDLQRHDGGGKGAVIYLRESPCGEFAEARDSRNPRGGRQSIARVGGTIILTTVYYYFCV